ncbi:MAG: 16S rRNA (guanine(527)-N(7))-methyltransferase RsmG [Bacteroides sp.]|nr:16S rRNA (guanine(527)-N(7))-methyltransferase RsmG [Bacteroides sp.]MCM1379935.1 16S rRNA (guanine(527)-N(7))-methyltransferase RsmG [Bacteroides sp.]MCM1446210.1 16S rRNA (guanine(527)-N(7))-methyltransferase RsmG [Prevotella sp.]
MEEILKYYPNLTELQRSQLEALQSLYSDLNAKINVISRKDIDNLYVNHVLHSMVISKFITPVASTRFIDLGCGGGFPGIPLAILWPECSFHLIDRIGKKVKVAETIASAIGLKNVTFQHGDSGECHEKFDYVVSRAVMTLPDLIKASQHLIGHKNKNKLPNGIICLKGGDLTEEMRRSGREILAVPLSDYYSEPYYQTKRLLYTPL